MAKHRKSPRPKARKQTRKSGSRRRQDSAAMILREDSPPYRVNGNGANHKLRFIDLFAGIGGIRIGLERAGGECVFSSEWDADAAKSYEALFGEKPAGDITKISNSEIPDHDILAGGFPC